MANWFYTDANGLKQGPINEQQLVALAAKGIITRETVVENERGKSAPAGRVKGLTFAETKQPETVSPVQTELYDFASLPLSSFTEPNSVFDALPTEHAPFVAPKVQVWTEPPKPQSPFTQPKVLVPVCVGGGMVLMLLVMFAFSMISGSKRERTQEGRVDKIAQAPQVQAAVPPVQAIAFVEPQKRGGELMFVDLPDKAYAVSNMTFTTLSAWNNSPLPLLRRMSDLQKCCDNGMYVVLDFWTRCLQLGANGAASRSVAVPDRAIQNVFLCFQSGSFYTNIEQSMSSIREEMKKLEKNKYGNTVKLYGILSLYEKSVKEVSCSYDEYQKQQQSLREEFTRTLALAELEW